MDHKDMQRQAQKAKAKEYCKKFTKFMFSHIGLCGMVMAYAVAGGFIFEHLEKHNEQKECEDAMFEYIKYENTTLVKLFKVHEEKQLGEYFVLLEFQKILRSFRNSSVDLKYKGINCSAMGEKDGPPYSWSFPGALLFSVTVITTIGYGNIAPVTFWGRLVCIAYATLGIPLMLLCLANIGDVMADIFRFIYSKVCCCGCCRRKDKNKVMEIQSHGGSGTKEAWNTDFAADYHKHGNMIQQRGPTIIDDEDDEDEDEEEKITVPLTITMVVIAGYILGGALLFGMWEGWQPLKASYFCYVTLTTIGFGDIVPGFGDMENTGSAAQMVLSAIYMLFGMAILSMCFSLMQDEIVAKFKWIGEKIGLVEKDKDDRDKRDEDD